MKLDVLQPSKQPVKGGKAGQLVEPVAGIAGEPPLDEIVTKLEDKLSQAKARQTAISSARKTISLAAHMGSEDHRARLDQLNQEGAILSGEIESIEAAIAEVQAQIIAAKTAAAVEADRQKRQGLLRLADELRGHADKVDDLWRQSIAEYLVLQGKLHEIAQSSGGRPAIHVVQSACRRALISAFIGTSLQLQFLAPGERHTIADLVGSWVRNAGANQAPSIVNEKDAA